MAITRFGEPTLTGALDQLCEVDVVSRRGVAPALRYRFRHALLCDAAYESLLKAKRRDIHGRIVAFLETRDSSEPELLAQHAYQAGRHDQAIQHLRAAASRDFAQSAYTEAAAHAARALRWIRELPESDTLLVTEAKLQVMHAYALIPHGGYSTPRTTKAFDRAADIARMTDDISISVPALTGKALVRLTRGDHAELESSTDELERICKEDGRDYMRFYGAMMKGFAHLLRGEIEPGRQLVAEAKRLYVDDHERRGLRAGYPMWDSLTWWEQQGAWLAGDTAYDAPIAESMELAVRGEHDLDRPAFARCWQPTFYTLIALAQGDLDLAYRLAKRTLELATKHDIPSYIAWSTSILAIHEMARGDVERGFQLHTEANAKTAASEFGWGQAAFQIEFAKALSSRGLVAEAKEICRDSTETLARTQELWWEAEVHRVHGDVCLAEGNRKGAESAYRRAIEVAQGQGALAWERRARASLASLAASPVGAEAEERR
jgi:tetratricopeptide (TPR) repeat protein